MEERELIAFTAMSKQEYEELKKAQEVKIAKKLREAKNTRRMECSYNKKDSL